jgi:hypothetical protein
MKRLVLIAVLAMMVMVTGSVMAQEISPQLQEWLSLGDLDALDAKGNGFVFKAERTFKVTIPEYLEKVDTPRGSAYPGDKVKFLRREKVTLWFRQPQLVTISHRSGNDTATPQGLGDFSQFGNVQKLANTGGRGWKLFSRRPVEVVVPVTVNKIDTPTGSYTPGQTCLLDGEATLWFKRAQ